MKVFSNNIVVVDDDIAFTIRRDKATKLVCGKVLGFTEQTIRVSYVDPWSSKLMTSNKMPHNVVKICPDKTLD